MTFSSRLKEEITEINNNLNELRAELSGILRYDSKYVDNKLILTSENAKIARRIYLDLKELFGVNINIIIRNQKRLRVKQIYILEIKEKVNLILESLNIIKNNNIIPANKIYFDTREEKVSLLRGTFLSVGSINDPKTSGYHLEFVFETEEDAIFIKDILKDINFDSKIIKRNNRFMVYIKSAEEISDLIKLFKAINSLFYFEDIRIYRDHKNMVNRLNNCDVANQEKTTRVGMKQVKDIMFLKEHDLFTLLDDKTKIILEYRLKYPEVSFSELADIITLETDIKIGKSGINHHFIKMKNLVTSYQEKL